MGEWQPQVALQILSLERKDRVALGDRHQRRVLGPPGTLGQGSIHDEPSVRDAPVLIADGNLQSPALSIDGSCGVQQVANRMGSIVIRQRYRDMIEKRLTCPRKGVGPCQYQ